VWYIVCVSEAYIIFSGGTPADPRLSTVPSLTVMKGNNMTVLEMEHEVVDFVTLSSTPWNSGMQCIHFLSIYYFMFYVFLLCLTTVTGLLYPPVISL